MIELAKKKNVNGKNIDTNKNNEINFDLNINSTEKMLWPIQLGKGRLQAPNKVLVNTLQDVFLLSALRIFCNYTKTKQWVPYIHFLSEAFFMIKWM